MKCSTDDILKLTGIRTRLYWNYILCTKCNCSVWTYDDGYLCSKCGNPIDCFELVVIDGCFYIRVEIRLKENHYEAQHHLKFKEKELFRK